MPRRPCGAPSTRWRSRLGADGCRDGVIRFAAGEVCARPRQPRPGEQPGGAARRRQRQQHGSREVVRSRRKKEEEDRVRSKTWVQEPGMPHGGYDFYLCFLSLSLSSVSAVSVFRLLTPRDIFSSARYPQAVTTRNHGQHLAVAENCIRRSLRRAPPGPLRCRRAKGNGGRPGPAQALQPAPEIHHDLGSAARASPAWWGCHARRHTANTRCAGARSSRRATAVECPLGSHF